MPLDPATRRSIPQTSGNHERRLYDVERARHGPWIAVGGTHPDSPPYLGDWSGNFRFRWLIGGGFEIDGVGPGTLGTTAWKMPEYLWPDRDTPWIPCADSDGNFQVYMVLAVDGSVIIGVP
jgi:hypothetical protein